MGDFRLELNMVGGHGCERQVKDGETFTGCGKRGCPDCAITNVLKQLRSEGIGEIKSATLTHWPGQPSQVVDEFVFSHEFAADVKRKRHGSF